MSEPLCDDCAADGFIQDLAQEALRATKNRLQHLGNLAACHPRRLRAMPAGHLVCGGYSPTQIPIFSISSTVTSSAVRLSASRKTASGKPGTVHFGRPGSMKYTQHRVRIGFATRLPYIEDKLDFV